MMRVKVLGCLFVAAFFCTATGPVHGEEIAAITRPSEDVTLSFVRAGRIAKVFVKDGDEVKAGQLLVQQDDMAERVQLEQLKAEADDTVRIQAAEDQLAQKEVDFHKLEEAFRKRAVSKWDVEHARLDVAMAKLSLELQKFQHRQNGLKYEEARIQLERMRLMSPLAGKIEKTFVKLGESADALAEVVRIVKIDPLWIEVPAPLETARNLLVGGLATVVFPKGTGQPGKAKIIHIGAVADAASNTLTVRVELPNPAARPAGEHVRVTFPVNEPRNTR